MLILMPFDEESNKLKHVKDELFTTIYGLVRTLSVMPPFDSSGELLAVYVHALEFSSNRKAPP